MRSILIVLLSVGIAAAGEPPIIQVSSGQRERIRTELVAQPTDTLVESVRRLTDQVQILTEQQAALSRDYKELREECRLRVGKLENRAWQSENPGVTYPGQPTTRSQPQTTRTTERRIVDAFRGDHDGSPNPHGAYWIRHYSDGQKTRARLQTQVVRQSEPVVRSAVISRPVQRSAPVTYGSSYMQPSNMGWGSSFYGGGMMSMGAACVGGS